MKAHRYLFLLVALIVVGATTLAKRHSSNKKCGTREHCLNDKKCQCYCSGIAAFRDKVDEDEPIYIENDPNGVHCYCKQWDLDVYPGPATRSAE